MKEVCRRLNQLGLVLSRLLSGSPISRGQLTCAGIDALFDKGFPCGLFGDRYCFSVLLDHFYDRSPLSLTRHNQSLPQLAPRYPVIWGIGKANPGSRLALR